MGKEYPTGRRRDVSITNLTTLLIILMPTWLSAQEATLAKKPFFGPAPSSSVSISDVRKQFDALADKEIFAATMNFEQTTNLSNVRLIVEQLEIPRVLVFATPKDSKGRPHRLVWEMGKLFEGSITEEFHFCKMATFAMVSGFTKQEIDAADTWPVSKIHVTSTVETIRELEIGALPPAAKLKDGNKQRPGTLAHLSQIALDEARRKIQTHGNFTPLPQCQIHSTSIDAGTLSGLPLPYRTDLSREQQLHDQLSEIPLQQPVTLSIRFKRKMTIREVASLTELYPIAGLTTEFQPDKNDRVIMIGEYSQYGEPLPRQIKRTQCQIDWSNNRAKLYGKPVNESTWYAKAARVTVPASTAMMIIEYENIESGYLVSKFELSQLETLKNYYETRSNKKYNAQTRAEIPLGCEQFIRVKIRS